MPEYIHLIRHGQSTFNALFDLNRVDPLHFDARLSQIGIEQVAAARHAALDIPADLVVVSPLTRAIQTAVGLFGEADVPIIVTDRTGSGSKTAAISAGRHRHYLLSFRC